MALLPSPPRPSTKTQDHDYACDPIPERIEFPEPIVLESPHSKQHQKYLCANKGWHGLHAEPPSL
jgi:hypothetical protein